MTSRLNCLHLNARSRLAKVPEITLLAARTNATVISISETHLDSSITDNEIKIDGYSILRHDRDQNGGGVCVCTSATTGHFPEGLILK